MSMHFDIAHGIDGDDLQFILDMSRSFVISRTSSKDPEILTPDEATLRDGILTKYLLISSVSYFEASIKYDIEYFFKKSFKSENEFLSHFIYKSVLDRGFYSLFQWKNKNGNEINHFLEMVYGSSNRYEIITKEMGRRKDLQWSIKTFYAMFAMRNVVVHMDAHQRELPVKYTLREIIDFYKDSRFFIENFKYILEGEISSISEWEKISEYDDITLNLQELRNEKKYSMKMNRGGD